MTDKEEKIWTIITDFHRKLELLDKGYTDACCKIDSHKTYDEILDQADEWYNSRAKHMIGKLISELEPIMKGDQI